GTPPANTAPQNLWNVVLHASAAGTVTFTPSFDNNPVHDVSLFSKDDRLTSDEILFTADPLQIIGLPGLSISDVTQAEGNSGNTPFVFTVSLASVAAAQVTVEYTTQDASATTAGNDYVAQSGTLTFAPGQTTALVTINVKGDTTVEGDEAFNVVLSNPSSNAALADSVGLGTILNDDVSAALPSIVIANAQTTNVTSGTTDMVFTVSLSAT